MRKLRKNSGLTAVELLVTIVIAALLLGAAYQLFNSILQSSSKARARAEADSIAYDILRDKQQSATNPCTAQSIPTNAPTGTNLPTATVVTLISCPYGNTSPLSMVTVKVEYNDPDPQEVTRAIIIEK